jgi:hypothetical protein
MHVYIHKIFLLYFNNLVKVIIIKNNKYIYKLKGVIYYINNKMYSVNFSFTL